MSVDKKAAFVNEAATWGSPTPTAPFQSVIANMDTQERERDTSVTTGALNNCHGDWYEWLLAIIAWNLRAGDPALGRALLLPNSNQFDVAKLYESKLNGMVDDLRATVREEGVELITSNPDFVIIRGDVAAPAALDEEITAITPGTLAQIQTAYTEFEGKCGFEDIAGFVSVKNSLRPDRRLQLAHEGSLWKALYGHLRTRQWIVNPSGLQYHAVVGRLNESDKEALATVATHSIVTVSEKPERAVDSASLVSNAAQGRAVFGEILKP